MARIEHRRVLLRLYEDVPQHQEILRWLDGYSGRGLQEILRGALLIGLPRLLSESSQERTDPKLTQPQRPEPSQALEPERTLVPKQSVPEQQGAMPDFVPSSQKVAPEGTENQDVARKALGKLFETEDVG
ncbi:MAG: hypothetical protein ACYCY2_00500 [Acidithiobacillus ferriphilus]